MDVERPKDGVVVRVLIAAGPVGALSASQAGAALATGLASGGHQVALIPLADPGPDFGRLLADLSSAPLVVTHGGWAVATDDLLAVGGDLVTALRQYGPRPEIVLDLTAVPEGQADELAATLGTFAAAGSHLTGVVHAAEVGGAAAEAGVLAVVRRPTGAGAAGGLGTIVLRAGGQLVSSPGFCAARAGLGPTMAQAGLVITAATRFDVGSHGGDVVPFVTSLALDLGKPVVLVAETLAISRRELRANGIEEAIALADAHPISLVNAGKQLAHGW
ncbi:MAG: glycerate kinase [Propionibacteriaceae bacterium]|nr:glycerate kinase [Micropruina sp.]HBX80358.1 hypothetical protein [Propionibacteriaceae bacterium]HBY22476.1 hypothetical protein [Propionibacteriaceae bacterium]